LIRILVVLLSLSANLYAGAKEENPPTAQIGVYLTSLFNFDYKMGTFGSSYYLWTVSKSPKFNPLKTLEIINATDYTLRNPTSGKNPDGSIYNTFHIYSTNQHFWDTKYFPFDIQKLKIRVEDANDIRDISFVADTKESGVIHGLELDGWKIINVDFFVKPFRYNTNFGDHSVQTGIYSRFTAIITIKREGLRIFFNYFAGFLVAIILSALIFFIDPNEIGARSGYALSSIFAIVGNKYIVDRQLPLVNEFTLTDAVQFLSFTQVIIAVLVTLRVFKLAKNNQIQKAYRISRVVGSIVVPIVVLSLIFFLTRAWYA
jgi:hypothetical protein